MLRPLSRLRLASWRAQALCRGANGSDAKSGDELYGAVGEQPTRHRQCYRDPYKLPCRAQTNGDAHRNLMKLLLTAGFGGLAQRDKHVLGHAEDAVGFERVVSAHHSIIALWLMTLAAHTKGDKRQGSDTQSGHG